MKLQEKELSRYVLFVDFKEQSARLIYRCKAQQNGERAPIARL